MCYNNCIHFVTNTYPGEEYCNLKRNQTCPEDELYCEACGEELVEGDTCINDECDLAGGNQSA